MSKVKYVSLIIIQFVIILTLVININKPKEIMNDNNTKNNKKNKDTISMMLETEAGSGNYELTTRDSWPTEGYIFNNDLSKCDHGSELSWDDTNKAVVMTGNMSDKCYVYFDKVEKAVINEILTSDITTESITLTISANKGTYDINKYFYSIDNGLTWNESTSNIIVVSNLTKGTEYTIKVYVQDNKGLNSEYKSLNVTTLSTITFIIGGTTYYADPGMTWEKWLNSTYSNNFPNKNYITTYSKTDCSTNKYINAEYVTTEEMCKNVCVTNYDSKDTILPGYIYLNSGEGVWGSIGDCATDMVSSRGIPIIVNNTIESTISIYNEKNKLSINNNDLDSFGCSIKYNE